MTFPLLKRANKTEMGRWRALAEVKPEQGTPCTPLLAHLSPLQDEIQAFYYADKLRVVSK